MPIKHKLSSQSPYRDRFVFDDSDAIYLDGNSLGRLLKKTRERIREIVDEEWGIGLIGSWNRHWLGLSHKIGEKIGQLIGAYAGETIVADSTSINLYKIVHSILSQDSSRKTILTHSSNFPSNIYVMEGIVDQLGNGLRLELLDLETDNPEQATQKILASLNEDTALVSLSHVNFKSGFAFDISEVTRAARSVGAKTVWDLSHSVGVMPIELNSAGADAAVGSTYKFLNGGPGSPAFLWLHGELHRRLNNPIKGWFGSSQPFQFSTQYMPHPSIDRFMVGTPPVLSLAAIEPGVDLVLEAGMEWIRNRSVELSQMLIDLIDERLLQHGYQLISPRTPAARGSQISIAHEKAWQITQDLIESFHIVPDFREPDTIRIGISPLYNDFTELEKAVVALESSVVNQTFLRFSPTKGGVT